MLENYLIREISSSVDYVIRLPLLLINYSEACMKYSADMNVLSASASFSMSGNASYSEWMNSYRDVREQLPKDITRTSVASERIIAGLLSDNVYVNNESKKLALRALEIKRDISEKLERLQDAIDKARPRIGE